MILRSPGSQRGKLVYDTDAIIAESLDNRDQLGSKMSSAELAAEKKEPIEARDQCATCGEGRYNQQIEVSVERREQKVSSMQKTIGELARAFIDKKKKKSCWLANILQSLSTMNFILTITRIDLFQNK